MVCWNSSLNVIWSNLAVSSQIHLAFFLFVFIWYEPNPLNLLVFRDITLIIERVANIYSLTTTQSVMKYMKHNDNTDREQGCKDKVYEIFNTLMQLKFSPLSEYVCMCVF